MTPPPSAPFTAGERLRRAEFHARYLLTPEDFRAKLVGGVVHLPWRRTWFHGTRQSGLIHLFTRYDMETPGVEALGRTTILLDDESEVEPDGCVYMKPSFRGRVRLEDGYLAGAPELVAEIADPHTEELDSVAKLRAYKQAGVIEYLLILSTPPRVRWFIRHEGRLADQAIPGDGVLPVRSFPGLWLDTAALLANDLPQVVATLQRGLGTPEHAAFVVLLASRRQGPTP